MTPIQLSDLTVGEWSGERDGVPFGWRERPVFESELLSLFTDEALLGELVKRGVLALEGIEVCAQCGNSSFMVPNGCTWDCEYDTMPDKPLKTLVRKVTTWREPVGSVGETP